MILDQTVSLLRNVELFDPLDDGALRLLGFSGKKRTFNNGDFVFSSGQVSQGALIVAKGIVDIAVLKRGTAEVQKTVERGAILGEMALLTSTKHTSTAIARGEVETLFIGRNLFHRVLQQYPEAAVYLHRKISDRVAVATGEIAQLKEKFSQS